MARISNCSGNQARKRAILVASLVALFGVTCIAGGALIAASVALPPMATGFWRLALAGPICLLICLWAGGGTSRAGVLDLLLRRHVWIAGAAFALTLGLWYSGQRLSSITSTSALHNLAPILIVSLAWIATGVAPRALTVAGIASALAGATLLA
jgi:drug/metabolite transporter (DMT)-like permease